MNKKRNRGNKNRFLIRVTQSLTNTSIIFELHDSIKTGLIELNVATSGVANATKFFSLVTHFSRFSLKSENLGASWLQGSSLKVEPWLIKIFLQLK